MSSFGASPMVLSFMAIVARVMTCTICVLLLLRLLAGFCYAVLVATLRLRVQQLKRALNELVDEARHFSFEEKLVLLKPEKELYAKTAAVTISGEV